MRARPLLRVLALCGVLACPVELGARQQAPTPVRGMVLSRNQYLGRTTPVPGARVSVYTRTATPRRVAETYTDTKGFFYLRLAPATYLLRVPGGRSYELRVIPLDRRRFQFQDVPPIVL